MMDAHGVDSDGESDDELEEDGVVRRSSRDIPSHLDYREPETNDVEEEASEDDVSEGEIISEQVTEVIECVDDSENNEEEEDVYHGQKRDTASAELTTTPMKKAMKIKSITWGNHRAKAGAEDQNNNHVINFIEETMDDFMKILSSQKHTCILNRISGDQVIYWLIMFKPFFRN